MLPLSETDLPRRAYRALSAAGITDLATLSGRPTRDLLVLPGFGVACLLEVNERLTAAGLAPVAGSLHPPKPPRRRPGPRRYRFRDLLTADEWREAYWGDPPMSVAQIGAALGLSPAIVHNCLRYHGIPTRSRQEGRRLNPRGAVKRGRKPRKPRPTPAERRAARIQRDYLPATAAAEKIDMDRSDFNKHLRAGKYPGAFQFGGVWFVPVASLEKQP